MEKITNLPKILQLHAQWLSNENTGNRANLEGANLRGADLQGANLRGADLQVADLRRADLRGADLRGAGLEGADLRDADLRGADLTGANLFGIDAQYARSTTERIISIMGFKWGIVIVDKKYVRVGCKSYAYHKWLNFSYAEITAMDIDAIEFYPILLKILDGMPGMDKTPDEGEQCEK